MTYEEAVEQVAKESECSPSQLPVCGEEGAKLCNFWPCTRVKELMAQRPIKAPATADVLLELPSGDVVATPRSNQKRALVLPTDAAERNKYPMFDGLFGYFASALAEVARLSFIANEQHNPGEPMHWARDKSTDHKNKIVKHLLDAEFEDTDGTLHATKLAWRALALLQLTLEKRGAPTPPNAY